MAQLPDETSRSLVRAISAYMKATPAPELPAALRALRNFTPRALNSHKERLFGAFEDGAFAARVLEWLEKSAPKALPSEEARLLRLFAERPQGWEQELARRAPRAPASSKPAGQSDLERALSRERERARRAEERERRAKEAERAAVAEGKAKADALERELESLKKQLGRSREETARLRGEAAWARRRYEQAQRKALREGERARLEREKLRAEVKAGRRRARETEARAERLERALARAEQAASGDGARTRAPAKERRPLPVPMGRPGDDPESLEEWLDAPGVHLLVDGYNVTKAEGGFGTLELESQRQRIVTEIARLARKKRIRATIVFDGALVPAASQRKKSAPVAVEYSKPPENADDHLVARLRGLGPEPVVVATDDRELQRRASELGATIASSAQLLELIR